VLLGIRWLDSNTAKRWRQGQVDCLQAAIQTSPSRIDAALQLLCSWATAKGLLPNETPYVAQTPGRQMLRFSDSGDPAVEQQYRTHWLSPEVSEKQRARLIEKAGRPSELVVIQPLNNEWACHRCGGSGDLLVMENGGPACLKCVGLDDLEFLGAGDALLTRRAKAKSARVAVVVRFSRCRKRYQRQGLLVEPQALAAVEGELPARSAGAAAIRREG
jgi:hypothetical protein